MISRTRHGFTIVEMLIVVVVIAMLTVITATIYLNAQVQARDTRLQDAADKTADAMQLFISKNGHFPRGGSGSTAAIGTGSECADGVDGFITKGVYTCTVADTLVASGYIPAGFYESLPSNTAYNPSSTKNLSVMVYSQSGRRGLVMYAQEDVPIDDPAFTAVLQKCGVSDPVNYSPRSTWGMRAGVCFNY
jgi:prepilin-type N-terminal cleavage/methylation domain-containing protein